MRMDSKLERFWMIKKELYVISRSLIEFSQEMHWFLDLQKDKNFFESKFEFSIGELDYIMSELWELEVNLRNSNIVDIFVLLFEQTPKKPKIIFTALSECSKNFEDYEISIRAGFSKQELDDVLKEFKEKVIDVIKSA